MDEHNVFLRPPLWLPIVVALIAGGAYIAGKTIEADTADRAMITVSGEGKISAVPDIAQLTFGVQTGPQRTATEAMDKLEALMTSSFEAVKALGIDEKDIATESLWMNPVYDWNEGRQILRGYEASQTLRVKVRDLDAMPDVLSAATNAGANQAGGVSFTIDDPQELRDQARQEAIAKAQENAQKLADQLGVRLVKITGFSEGGGGVQPPVPYLTREAMGMDADMAKAGVPLPAGEQEITVQVQVTYEIR